MRSKAQFFIRTLGGLLPVSWKRLTTIEEWIGVVRFIAALIGLGSVGGAIAWTPWLFILAMLALGWALIDSAYRVHARVPTGNVLTHARKTIREAANEAAKLAKAEYTTFPMIYEWYKGVTSILHRISPHCEICFTRDCTLSAFEGYERNPEVQGMQSARGNLRLSVGLLEGIAERLTPFDIDPNFDIYSSD